jgi:hypothetical protein
MEALAKDRLASALQCGSDSVNSDKLGDFKASEEDHGDTACDQGDKKSHHHCVRHSETP